MAQMPEKRPRSGPSPVDRLTVLYIVGSVLTLIAIFALMIYTNAQLAQQNRVIGQQTIAIEQLNIRVGELLDTLQDFVDQSQSGGATPTQQPPAALPASARPTTDGSVLSELASIAPRSAATGNRSLGDAAAARALIDRTSALPNDALEANTWEQLAVLAILLNDAPSADRLIRLGGRGSAEFLEGRARLALSEDEPRDAVIAARELVRTDSTPRNTALLAAAELRAGLRGDAARNLQTIPETQEWPDADRLMLAQTCVGLHRWEAVTRILDGWRPNDAKQARTANLLRAEAAVLSDEPVVGLAIADELLANNPGDVDALLWRGAALVQGKQTEAAQQVLSATNLPIGAAETWYWRGRLALLEDDPERALQMFDQSVAHDSYYAPALEALAATKLNADQPRRALTDLNKAIEAAPQRASAHLLHAVILSRIGNTTAARGALSEALKLEPALRSTAEKTEALAGLLSE